MQYYKVKLRLDGNPMNEIEKKFSAPEILVLQFIHGVDSITNIRFIEEINIPMDEEKQRLKSTYDQALVKREQSIDTIFGPLGQVCNKLPDNMTVENGVVDEDDIITVAKNATKADKSGRVPENITEENRLKHIVPQDEISMNDMMQ